MAGKMMDDTVVEITLSCRNLRALDKFSHSDPMCVLYTKCGIRGHWVEEGRTESVKNTGDPEWEKSFNLKYYFHQKQSLRFSLYDVDSDSTDLGDHDNLGTAECTLAQILATQENMMSTCIEYKQVNLPLSPYKHKPGDCGELLVRAVEVSDGSRDRVTLDLTAQNLDKKDLFSESDPFYCVYRNNTDGTDTLVYRSEWIKDTASPDWAPITLDCAKLCLGDWDRNLRIEVYDWDRDGGHDFIGDCNTTMEELSQGEDFQILQFDLINPKKVEKKGYHNSGQIVVKSIKIEQDNTFLDYVRGGLKINLAVAVDLTDSNGVASCPTSLHHIHPDNGENAYTTAMHTVGEILQDYNYDKKIMGLGFGAEVGGVVNHCFPLNGDARNPYCKGVEGLVNSYMNSLNSVSQAEPTWYSSVLRFAAEDAMRCRDVEYTVILLITDGGVADLQQTKQALVEMSRQPISVVLVGVGEGDMSALVQLDSDRARLSCGDQQAERDIVQFVELRKYIDHDKYHHEHYEPRTRLARAVLQEIPRQVTEYMRKKGIAPRIPDIPDILQEDFDKKFNI